MTIERTLGDGLPVGGTMTSWQANAIDANHENAIDKRAGQSDVFGSMLVATGSARIIPSVQTGPDASATFHVSVGASLVRVPTLTAARTYTLGHSGATGGDRVLFAIVATGATASGYAEIKNTSGTGLFRLGRVTGDSPNDSAQDDRAEFIMGPDGQWALFGNARSARRRRTFTRSTTWTCPPGVYEVLLEGCGGGGGGAGGTKVPANISGYGTGGGGGGGATRYAHRQEVTPGVVYEIVIGTGGTGGAGSDIGLSPGNPGGDSTFGVLGGAVLKRFPGGGGGRPGLFVQGAAVGLALGGGTIKGWSASGPTGIAVASGYGYSLEVARAPGDGGYGVHGVTGLALQFINAGIHYGMGNNGYTGGAPGAMGLETSLFLGGGGGFGGGGGAGGFGDGGIGGDGGDGVGSPGAAEIGSDGGTPAEFSGAGGGGGGGGGSDDIIPIPGGAGGDGADGRIDVSW